ncbi:MAG: hypothetical protein HOQ09_02830, partial [Gemmatimonadaceae bacterium]|nr:hypothetical protein [Gemmatimonadaceae bacterium]
MRGESAAPYHLPRVIELHLEASVTLLQLALMIVAAQPAPRSDTLRILLVVDDTSGRSSLVHGSTLGAEEVMHSGALFGTPAVLRVAETRDSLAVARALDPGARSSIVIVAGTAAICDAVVASTVRRAIAVFDAGCAGAGIDADSNVYSLVRLPTASPGDDSTRLELWHPTL